MEQNINYQIFKYHYIKQMKKEILILDKDGNGKLAKLKTLQERISMAK